MGKKSLLIDILFAFVFIALLLIYKWAAFHAQAGTALFWMMLICQFLLGIVLGWSLFWQRIAGLGRLAYDFRRLFIIGLPLLILYLAPYGLALEALPWPNFLLSFFHYLEGGREFYAPFIPAGLGYLFITGFYKKSW